MMRIKVRNFTYLQKVQQIETERIAEFRKIKIFTFNFPVNFFSIFRRSAMFQFQFAELLPNK